MHVLTDIFLVDLACGSARTWVLGGESISRTFTISFLGCFGSSRVLSTTACMELELQPSAFSTIVAEFHGLLIVIWILNEISSLSLYGETAKSMCIFLYERIFFIVVLCFLVIMMVERSLSLTAQHFVIFLWVEFDSIDFRDWIWKSSFQPSSGMLIVYHLFFWKSCLNIF